MAKGDADKAKSSEAWEAEARGECGQSISGHQKGEERRTRTRAERQDQRVWAPSWAGRAAELAEGGSPNSRARGLEGTIEVDGGLESHQVRTREAESAAEKQSRGEAREPQDWAGGDSRAAAALRKHLAGERARREGEGGWKQYA
ncbi:uncharacterized protein PSANT_02992 [Moesziomyces antarcticus]|uniref:Uncharacterized protein n=1 Tax=Pseudozyma antarctica TaxID=84753 RepID=A0A5C3FM79_PSEA2|nr:uncharacterized protein PSANT_02992 [Moesziomyces antarcticus]